jgi:cytochrome bd-type quinol oxidase subunit 2
VYGLFALSASARASVQIATKFHEAPLAFLLSALAAVIYIVATVALARNDRRLAIACCSVELLGVLAIGTASLLDRAAFPDPTVWSGYGMGYGFVPLVLPVLGLWWLRRTRRA